MPLSITCRPPKGGEDSPLTALVFDSFYDNYKGAISYVRVMDGMVKQGTRIKFMSNGKEFDVTEVGVFTPAFSAWRNTSPPGM